MRHNLMRASNTSRSSTAIAISIRKTSRDDSDAKALMLFDEIKPQLAAFDQNAAARIAASFELFDFAAAAAIIASLRSRLG